MSGFDTTSHEYASDRRDSRRAMPLDEIDDRAMHTDERDLLNELPDYTLDQLILKLAWVNEQPIIYRNKAGWISVSCTFGRFDFSVSEDGTRLEIFQVM